MVRATFEPELGKQRIVACVVRKHGTQNWCHDDERGDCGEYVGEGQAELHEIGQQVMLCAERDGCEQRGENDGAQGVLREQALPVLVLGVVRAAVGVTVQAFNSALRQEMQEFLVNWFCTLDAERRGEGCDNGHRDDNRIEKVADNAKAHAQRSNDEGKFANLRKAETAVYRSRKTLPGSEHAERGENQLADNGRHNEYENRQCLLKQQRGIYEHADGNEEDGAEEIFDRRN